MNWDLINDFREKVNENMFLWCAKSNSDKINNWNIICACMDWIDVSVENLKSKKFSTNADLQSCMDCYTFICCIDIACDALKKLHTVISHDKVLPWENDNTVFKKNVFNLTKDDLYFKKLRACFGAHPIDINVSKKNNNIKMYASWSMPGNLIGNNSDYCVKLYSGKDGIDNIDVEFKMSELLEYFEIRYNYLSELINRIDILYENFINTCKTNVISKDTDPIKQVEILISENKLRYDSGSLDELFTQIISFLKTSFSEESNKNLIDEFKNKIILGIDELYYNMQRMEDEELKILQILNPQYKPKNLFGYNYAKLYSHVFSNESLFYAKEQLIEPLKKYISFNYKTVEEFYWLVVISLNLAQEELQSEKENEDLLSNELTENENILDQLFSHID